MIAEHPIATALAADIRADAGGPGVCLWWLGQAGFALRANGVRLLIDPYLSDVLATKYRGGPCSHERLMPPPIAPADLHGFDACLCSHAHSDHMDPGALPPLAAASPACRFVVPRAARDTALSRGVPPERLVAVTAGDRLPLAPSVTLHAIAAAHERLETDAAGDHRFLGFILRLGGLTLYHSGDCVPYPGLAETLAAAAVDVALLPINGRDAARSAHGIAGNFTVAEAHALCEAARIPLLIPHHFGLFAFNTASPADLAAVVARAPCGLRAVVPRIGVRYTLWTKPPNPSSAAA